MSKLLLVLSIIIYAHAHSYAADKVRISMTGFAGQFMTFPLAQKRGFLKEEGIEAEIIRISAAQRELGDSNQIASGSGNLPGEPKFAAPIEATRNPNY